MYSPSFFIHDTSPNMIYTLSLHDALPILFRRISFPSDDASAGISIRERKQQQYQPGKSADTDLQRSRKPPRSRSEEHTSELQSRGHLVCRLLLEKKNKCTKTTTPNRRNQD